MKNSDKLNKLFKDFLLPCSIWGFVGGILVNITDFSRAIGLVICLIILEYLSNSRIAKLEKYIKALESERR